MRLNLLVAFSVLFTTAVAQWREATIQMPGTPAPVAAFYHPATGDVYVSGSSRYVSIVDPESCRIAGRIILPQGTPWWGYSSVRNKLYAGMMWDMVYVIDGATNMVIDSVCISGRASRMCYTPVNDKLYYVDDSWSEIGAITCANDSLVARIDVWEYPTAMLYNPVFNRICIALETDSVAVIDPATDSVVASIPVGAFPVALCCNTTNGRIYTANELDQSITVIDGATNTPLSTIAVNGSPFELAYNTVNNKLYCICRYSDSVTVIDAGTDSIIAVVPGAGYDACRLLYNPAANRVYCTGTRDSVAIIDGLTNAVLARLPTGRDPGCLCLAETSNRVLVTNARSNDLTVVDGPGDSIVATIPLLGKPVAACCDTTRNRVYCATGVGGLVAVIHGDSHTVVGLLTTGAQPAALCWSPAAGRVYCANSGSNTVSIIATASDSIVATVPTGSRPRALCCKPDGSRAYCADSGAARVSVIAGDSLLAGVPVGQEPVDLCFEPAFGRVWCANHGSNTVSVIDGTTNSVVATVPVGIRPRDLCLDPVRNRIFCANLGGNSLSVLDADSNRVVATIPVLSGPCALAFNPSNQCVYCVCSYSDSVVVVSCSSLAVVATVAVRDAPLALGYLPASNRLYVANWADNSVTGIHCGVNQPWWYTRVDSTPVDVTANPVTGRLYVSNYASGTVSVLRDGPVDVAAVGARVPSGEYELGDIVYPVACFRNYGNAPADFQAWVKLTLGPTVMARRVDVAGLAPGRDTLLTGFSPCTLSLSGEWWWARCSTYMAGDMVRDNDVTSERFVVRTPDIGVAAVTAPIGPLDTQAFARPAARWHNYHGRNVAFTAYATVRDPHRSVVYHESLRVARLDLGQDTTLTFPAFVTSRLEGRWNVRCSTAALLDTSRRNDRLARDFEVRAGVRLPQYGWAEMASMPAWPSSKPVKDGGWLQYVDGRELLYAAKGGKTGDFYSYDPVTDSWRQRAPVPPGREDRTPARGAAATTDGERYIYATKGNNTLGFYRYDVVRDTWRQLADVPLGASNKKVKGGTDVAWVEGDDRNYVYLLKGYKNEFYRFDIRRSAWETMPPAPVSATNQKWDRGSWLVYDDDLTLYAHRAKLNELWQYDLETDSWGDRLSGMPLMGRSGKKKKSKDGGCAVMPDEIYALKGGNTQEFWVYFVDDDYWLELDTIPARGSAGKRRIKAGADLATDYCDQFFALKGGRTREFWRYLPAGSGFPTTRWVRPSRDGVLAWPGATLFDREATLVRHWLWLSVASGADRNASPLLDITGRKVAELRPGRNDISRLAPGVYLLREHSPAGILRPGRIRKVVITK